MFDLPTSAKGVLKQIGFKGELAAFDANRCSFSGPTFAVVEGASVLHETFAQGRHVEGLSQHVSY